MDFAKESCWQTLADDWFLTSQTRLKTPDSKSKTNKEQGQILLKNNDNNNTTQDQLDTKENRGKIYFSSCIKIRELVRDNKSTKRSQYKHQTSTISQHDAWKRRAKRNAKSTLQNRHKKLSTVPFALFLAKPIFVFTQWWRKVNLMCLKLSLFGSPVTRKICGIRSANKLAFTNMFSPLWYKYNTNWTFGTWFSITIKKSSEKTYF